MTLCLVLDEAIPTCSEELSTGVLSSLYVAGGKVFPRRSRNCSDGGVVYRGLGLLSFAGEAYQVLLSVNGLSLENSMSAELRETLGIDHVDRVVRLLKGEYVGMFGFAPPIRDFSFEPSTDKVEFLRRSARILGREVEAVSSTILAYQPSRQGGYVYELLPL